jgi:hypothetical protein
MEPDGRSLQDMVHSRILKSLVALVSRHDPKLLLRLEADIGRFVSRLPPDRQGAAMACFSSFMGGLVSADFRAGAESLLDGAPDWIKLWLDTPNIGNGSSSLSFELIPRDTTWRVTLEGKLYGAFASRTDAVKAVTSAVDMIQQAGGDADWFDALH